MNNWFVIRSSVFYEHYAVKSIQLSLKLCNQCSFWFTLLNAKEPWPSKWPWEKTDCNPILISAILWSLGGILITDTKIRDGYFSSIKNYSDTPCRRGISLFEIFLWLKTIQTHRDVLGAVQIWSHTWGGWGGSKILEKFEDHYIKSHKKCEDRECGCKLSKKCVKSYMNGPLSEGKR